MSVESQSNDVIAKEITIAVIQSMEIGKYVDKDKIPSYVSNLYQTILKSVNNQ
jgi:hypothetical protein